MSFLLPSKYTMDTAPIPTDSRIKIHEIPERMEAVLTYSGNFNAESAEKMRDKLVELLKAKEIEHDAEKYTYAGYNPPFTLPWMKTNEIHIPVKL